MRSSGSTPSHPPEPPISLLLVIVGEDHPKACTGRRLAAAGLVRQVSMTRAPPGRPLLLDPYDDRPLTPTDRGLAVARGLLGIDCSWNRLGGRGRYPASVRWLDRLGERRRLPWLIATNPQHFGRIGELNTAEAFAAALYILGEPDRARDLLGRFSGGRVFFDVNAPAIDRYATCRSDGELRDAERATYSAPPSPSPGAVTARASPGD